MIPHPPPTSGAASRTGSFVLILLLVSIMLAANAWAQPTAPVTPPADPAKIAEQQAARRQALTHDREAIERARQDLRTRLADLPRQMEATLPEQIDEAMLEQTRVDAESARLRQESALSELNNSRRRLEDLQKGIGELEAREQLLKNPAKDTAEGAADRAEQLRRTSLALTQQRADLELENLNLANLRDQIEIAKLRLELAEQWRERIERTFQQRQEQGRRSAQAELVGRLQADLATQQDRANELRQRLSQNQGSLPLALWQRLVTELQTVEERTNLLSLDRHLAETANVLARLKDLPNNASVDPDDLGDALEQLAAMRDDLRHTEELLQQKSTVYEQQRQVIERREATTVNDRRLRGEELQLTDQLLADLSQRAGQAQDQLLQLNGIAAQLDQNYRERLRRDLFTRKPYPETAAAWGQLLAAMAAVPQVLFYQIRLSLESTIRALLDATVLRWAMLAVLEGMLIWGLTAAGRSLRQASRRLGEQRVRGDSFLRQLVASTLLLARANLGGAGFAAALLLLLWLVEVPQPGFGILMTLALSWLAIKLPVSLAWLLLVSPRLSAEQRQPALYRQLFWTLIGGGVLVALVVLTHLSDLSAIVVNAFDRLFMLYWFWAFLPVLRIRRLVVDLLSAPHGERLWFVVLRFGSLLLPLSLLGAAVLGLLGYLQLAWLVAACLLIFIAVQVGWLAGAQPVERSGGGAEKLCRDPFRLRFAVDSGHHHPPAPDSKSAAVLRCVGRAVPRLRLDRRIRGGRLHLGLSGTTVVYRGRGGDHRLAHSDHRHHSAGGDLAGAMEPGDQLPLGAVAHQRSGRAPQPVGFCPVCRGADWAAVPPAGGRHRSHHFGGVRRRGGRRHRAGHAKSG